MHPILLRTRIMRLQDERTATNWLNWRAVCSHLLAQNSCNRKHFAM